MTFVKKPHTYLPQVNSDAIFPKLTYKKPYFIQNQVEICAKKTNIHVYYSSGRKSWIFCFAQFYLITNLGQLSKPGTVLKSACPEVSKTVPES